MNGGVFKCFEHAFEGMEAWDWAAAGSCGGALLLCRKLYVRKGRVGNKVSDFSSSLALFKVEASVRRKNSRK